MAKQQKVVINIPRGIKPSDRLSLAEDIISYIQKRTSSGSRDKDGNRFAPYSKEYAKEKGSRKVDLMDSGDMLIQLTLLAERSGSITIGYPPGDPINGKVEGNRLGTYGKASPIPGKARDFLGIDEKELNRIVSKYRVSEFQANQEQSLDEQVRVLSSAQVERLERESFFRRLGLDSSL